jgi:hypothetical protein
MKLNDKEREMAYKAYVNEDCKLELHKSKGANEPGFVFKGSTNSLTMMLRKMFYSILINGILDAEMLKAILDKTIEEWEEEQNESK